MSTARSTRGSPAAASSRAALAVVAGARSRPCAVARARAGMVGRGAAAAAGREDAADLAVKAAAERQYLIFNLLAGGKLAWDAGDFATAATKWEACCA